MFHRQNMYATRKNQAHGVRSVQRGFRSALTSDILINSVAVYVNVADRIGDA